MIKITVLLQRHYRFPRKKLTFLSFTIRLLLYESYLIYKIILNLLCKSLLTNKISYIVICNLIAYSLDFDSLRILQGNKWRPLSLSESTPIVFYMEITHLGSNSDHKILKSFTVKASQLLTDDFPILTLVEEKTNLRWIFWAIYEKNTIFKIL